MERAPLPLLLLESRPEGRNRMAVAVLVSLTLHAILLAWHTTAGQPPAPPPATLEITLVNTRSPQAPPAPQALAQHDLDGGGDQGRTLAATPLPRIEPTEDKDQLLIALRARQARLESEQARLLTLLQSTQTHAQDSPSTQDDGPHTEPGDDESEHEAELLQARIAALKAEVEQYNARPRRSFVAPATQRAIEARYVEAWRERIELIGTEHYPPEARGRIYGDLQLTVFIRRDGQLDHIRFDRPSDQAVLNSAARRIIELAAPFDPLPPELAAHTDILAITRTWHFTRSGVGTAGSGGAP
ncbi:energy transducer TonB [Castellaniella sp.]|uniref:energy transducer TonB n=1 Tax=Castellaniella sp. TaxID=1955812 RepID=UPI0035688166